jgi:hypothetical protein
MIEDQPNDLITTREGRDLLGISRFKMAELLKDGLVRYFPDPLDKRVKLVSRTEILALKVRDKAA